MEIGYLEKSIPNVVNVCKKRKKISSKVHGFIRASSFSAKQDARLSQPSRQTWYLPF